MCSQIVNQKYTAPSSGHFWRPLPLPQACGLSLRQLFMYFSIKKKKSKLKIKNKKQFMLTIFKQFKQPFSIQKKTYKIIKFIFLCFQTLRGLVTKTKINTKEKLSVEKGPHIFDRKNRLGLGICQRFWTISCFRFFGYTFLSVFRGPFSTFFCSRI